MRAGIAVFAFLMASVAGAGEPGFYVGGGLNRVNYDVGLNDGIAVGIINEPFSGIFRVPAESSSTDDSPLGWTATVGYRFHRYVAAELSYVNFGEIANTEVYGPLNFFPFPPTITRTLDIEVRGPAVSVLGILPLGERVDLFARGGVLFADEKVRLRGLRPDDTTTYGDEIWLAGIGVDVSFGPRWTARLEYQRTDALKENVTFSLGEVELEQMGMLVMFRF